MTEPSWPDVSRPLPYHPQFNRSASITSYAPAPLKPAGVPIGPGYVDRPSMSAVVRPASAIAARQPSSVSSNGSRNNRRPISDWPTPVMHARRSMISLSFMLAPLAYGSRPLGCGRLPSKSRCPSTIRFEHGEVDVAVRIGVVLERHAHRHADLDLVERGVHEVRGEPHGWLLDDLDDRDDVRQLRAGHPVL